MNKYNSIFRILTLILILLLLLSFCGCKNEDEENLPIVPNNTNSVAETVISKPEAAPLPENPKNFKEITASYPTTCAWIQIPGIDVIDYPVMKSAPGMDDNFYIDHDIDGNKSREGSLYIQMKNSSAFDDPNTIIYGHNMGRGTMFGELKKFRDKTFFDEHKTIYIYTPGHILEYEIISAFVYDNRHILNSFEFNDVADRMTFFNTCVNPDSLTKNVREGATLDENDKIVTLSTCVPTGDENYRYLVIGKLIKDTPTK